MANFIRLILVYLILCGVVFFAFNSQSQPSVDATVRGGFVVPEYDANNKKRSVLYGEEAIHTGNRVYRIKDLKIETYQADEKPMWIVRSPLCFFDYNTRIAYSSNELKAVSVDNQYEINGIGFLWRQSDSSIIISNNVLTRIRLFSKATNVPAGTIRQEFEVKSDRFQFKLRSFEAVYSGNVEVQEIVKPSIQSVGLQMHCDELRTKIKEGGGGVEVIYADSNIKIQQGQNNVAAARAVYTTTNDQIELTGAARWTTAEAEGTADRIVLDRKNDRFISIGHIVAKAKGGMTRGLSIQLNDGQATSASTNDIIEIFSDFLSVKLPARGKPIDNLVAQTNVHIVQADAHIYADYADFNATTNYAMLNFFGNARWRVPGIIGRADTLRIDKLKNQFSAVGSTYISILTTNGVSQLNENNEKSDKAINVFADEFIYSSNKMHFIGNVRLEDPEFELVCNELNIGTGVSNKLQNLQAINNVKIQQKLLSTSSAVNGLWTINCEELQTTFNDAGKGLDRVVAKKNVSAFRQERPTNGVVYDSLRIYGDSATFQFNILSNTLQYARLTNNVQLFQLGISTNSVLWTNLALKSKFLDGEFDRTGRLTRAVAKDGVVIEHRSNSDKTNAPLKVIANEAELRMLTSTNLIEYVEARGEVQIEHGGNYARADIAQYSGTNDLVTLTGNSVLSIIESSISTNSSLNKVEVVGADTLVWDRMQNRFRGTGQYQIKLLVTESRTGKLMFK